jgi:hypothetical protein
VLSVASCVASYVAPSDHAVPRRGQSLPLAGKVYLVVPNKVLSIKELRPILSAIAVEKASVRSKRRLAMDLLKRSFVWTFRTVVSMAAARPVPARFCAVPPTAFRPLL